MIQINKEEKEAIRAELPYVHITRTMKQKSKRGHFFVEETKEVMTLIEKLRSEKVVYDGGDINAEV